MLLENRYSFLAFLLISFSANAAPSCDQLYAARDLLSAADCYAQSLNAPIDYEKALIAISTQISNEPKTPKERRAINLGFNLLSQMLKNYGSTADYLYWSACLKSFDAVEKDRGTTLPTHMFGILKELQTLLQTAINQNPGLHGYGPHRVLGMMHTQMPGIVGGDKILAEKLLKFAYENAPQFAANHIAYAKILEVNGKEQLARSILNRFLTLSDSDLNPYPSEPLRALAPENETDRKTARKILEDLEI